MNAAWARFEALSIGRGLLPAGGCVVAAVSGGRDSMVLLHALAQGRDRAGWRLVVAHFHHQLRGEDADADQAFVDAAARELGVPFVHGTADVGAMRASGESWESAARRLRHAFLARTAREWGGARVALGHHGGDQAELFLLRLLRGAGAAGLGGMGEIDCSPADPGIVLVRPLLGYATSEVEALAREWGVGFRIDATNADPAYARNRVRHELMPMLAARFQPAVERVLVREQTLLRDQAELLRGWAEEWLGRLETGGDRPFDALPVALQREVLRVQSARASLPLGFDAIEALREQAGVPIQVAVGHRVVRDAMGRLHPGDAGRAEQAFRTGCCEVPLSQAAEAGEVLFGGGTLRWRLGVRADDGVGAGVPPGMECFDADAVGERVRLRHWRPGDRFRPIGLGADAKLQDLFTNARVPAFERRHRVLAETSRGEIFWVEGLRIGECAKVAAPTVRTLRWSWMRSGDQAGHRPSTIGRG